jgi:hypothetical protein
LQTEILASLSGQLRALLQIYSLATDLLRNVVSEDPINILV